MVSEHKSPAYSKCDHQWGPWHIGSGQTTREYHWCDLCNALEYRRACGGKTRLR